ncbi:hypothetical protein BH23ACT10_BH23ACT10_35540 [soil metagenome]
MSHRIIDLDVARPAPAVQLSDTDTGLAIRVRRDGHHVGFGMLDRQPGALVPADDIADLAATTSGRAILHAAVRDALRTTGPPATPESITVAICTHDRTERLARCLSSLHLPRRSAERTGMAFEILVVDNTPTDDRTRHLVARMPDVRYTAEPRPGLDFARNRALSHASGELVAFLDDDVVADPGWLDQLLTAYAADPQAGAYTGQILPYTLETVAQSTFERLGGFRLGFIRVHHDAHGPGDWTYPSGATTFGSGANMIVRRRVALDIGGFDEALDMGVALPGGGDLDMFYRLVRAGYGIVYEPSCVVHHEHRRDLPAMWRQYRRSWGMGLMAFVAKCHRTDPSRRRQLRHFVLRHLRGRLRAMVASTARRQGDRRNAAVAELIGSVQGLLGGYRRARRQRDRIVRST